MTDAPARSPVAISAPGKVLLAGGYLVLDRAHTGLVFGLDARIHVHVQPLPTSDGVSLQEIVVWSPQFKGATWRYGYRAVPKHGGVRVTHLTSGPAIQQPNAFVETALSYVLTYIASILQPEIIEPASITILADNDYYSQESGNTNTSQLPANERFHSYNTPLWEAHKTGLGSSAALVTALIGAVLSYYLPEDIFSLLSDVNKHRLHNLAQAAHSAAQGKIGSGFDVASAVFGSCIYRRFSPSLLESLESPGSAEFATQLKDVVEDTCADRKWDVQIIKSKVSVPKNLRLVMCDVDCGSKTPGMVKQVLAWRKSNSDVASKLWSQLQLKNDKLAAELVRLTAESAADYDHLRSYLTEIRALIREVSRLSDVPIEPPAQTALLDACSQLPGVIGGVAPGAGGYDAVAILVEDRQEVITRLETLLDQWKFGGDDDGAGMVRLLGVREEMEGVRREDNRLYSYWTGAEASFG